MTVSSTTRKAGPFDGNGVTVAFPFAFKVFSDTDVLVVTADSTGAETTLTLGTDYTVALNADQNASPGGTVTLAAALPTGSRVAVASRVPNLQPTDITNNGGFYPRVIEDALDRHAVQIQQIAEAVSRAVKHGITSPLGEQALPAPVAGAVIGWNETNDGFENYPAAGNTLLAQQLASDRDDAGASLVGFKQPSATAVARTVGEKLREVVSVKDFGAKIDGSTDDTSAINAALMHSAFSGIAIRQPAGTMLVGGEIVFPSGAVWVGEAQHLCVVKKASTHTGRMLVTENFDAQTGNTDPDLPGLCQYAHMSDLTFDGQWMTADKEAYINDAGGGGLFVYAGEQCSLERIRVQNMAGVGVFLDAPVGNNAGNPIGYPNDARIDLMIDTSKEEGFIFRGMSDRVGMVVFQTNAGARINSELVDEMNPGPRSSPTYGAANGGLTDGVIVLRGTETAFIHAWGNVSGQGIRIADGRHNHSFFMAETNGYGGLVVESGYGDGNVFEAHRSGGKNGDTKPLVYFDAPMDGNVNYGNSVISAYHKGTFRTTPRNCVEFGPNARGYAGWVKTRGDNVPGHGIVIDGGATDLQLMVDCRGHVGTAADGLASAGLYRKATFTARSYTVRGRVANSAVGFRSSGSPRHERIELDMVLASGQVAFEGDARSGVAQVWNITADINGTLRASRNSGVSDAFSSSATSEQTVTINHGLIAAPAFGKAQVTGIWDSPSSLSAAKVQYIQVVASDATTITAKVKFETSNGTDTQPRLLWTAEV